ncbi:PcfJ domain-containing protein [Lysinibacillus sphaericus]|uniref:PcfJ domain-containing protein n=1 Tax=Lysinibacillus sphaericus TaxID=1421 RepID=UPI00056320F3|nr:PcfJ domain-containing protein [Lysinibacillus sphaericus]
MTEEAKRLLAHFPTSVSEELKEYVIEDVLKSSRYLFVKTVAGLQQCYCSHCKQSFYSNSEDKDNKFKHNELRKCEKCDSRCMVKQAGRGRSKLYDAAYVEWYEKSVMDSSVLIARRIYVARNYSGDYTKVETKFFDEIYYIFGPEETTMFTLRSYTGKVNVYKQKTTFSPSTNMKKYESIKNIQEAVKNTTLHYSQWEKYTNYDLLKFFGLACKYPSVELLTKFGLKSIVESKLTGRNTYRTVNWRARSLEGLFKLNKSDIRAIRDSSHSWETSWLYILQQLRTEKSRMKVEEVGDICSQLGLDSRVDDIKKLRQHASLQKILTYALKQAKRNKSYFAGYVFVEWLDYLDACQQLNMKLNERLFFPRNLHEAHQQTTGQIKAIEDAALNEKITKRVEELSKYEFEYLGLIIRPFFNSKEIVEEGKVLEHCVARNYMKSYAEGKTDLFAIRKKCNPYIPFYTAELDVKKKGVRQVRGFDNDPPTDEVNKLMEVFEEVMFKKSKVREAV